MLGVRHPLSISRPSVLQDRACPRRPARIRTPLFAVLGLLTLASPVLAQDDADEKSVVAVLRFDNNTGDSKYEHLGRALSSMTISDLSVIERIQLVERERLEELIQELDFQQSGYVDPASAQTVGQIIGADYMVVGAFVTVDPEMRLDTRIDRVATAEIVTTAEVRGQQESLFDLQQRLADQLVEGLNLVLTEEERARLRAQQEANRIDDMETMLAFSEALCLLDYGAYVDAFEVIQEVEGRAPGSAVVRATVALLRGRAEQAARDRVADEARSRIGGLLGRRQQPQRSPRPAQC